MEPATSQKSHPEVYIFLGGSLSENFWLVNFQQSQPQTKFTQFSVLCLHKYMHNKKMRK